MEPPTAEELVGDLMASLETSLQFYSQWQRRRVKENHYRKPGSASKPATNTSALGTSFNLASRIKETFEVGSAIIGSDFAAGDGEFPSSSPLSTLLHPSSPPPARSLQQIMGCSSHADAAG